MMLEVRTERLLTTNEAAARIGVTPGRIWQLIKSGDIKATRVGYFWLVPEKEVDKFKERPTKVGRPRSNTPQV